MLWLFTTPTSTVTVSDGILHWLAMPWGVVIYGGLLAIIYMFILPLIHTYRVTKQQEGGMKTGNWIAMIGLLLWAISAMSMAFVLFLAPIMLSMLALGFIGILLAVIGLSMFARASANKQ